MSTQTARDTRNASLVAAEAQRSRATKAAELEYSRTVARLRAQFEAGLAAAAERRLAAVRPHHRAYNAAVVAAERVTAEPVACYDLGSVRVVDVTHAEYRVAAAELQPVLS